LGDAPQENLAATALMLAWRQNIVFPFAALQIRTGRLKSELA
jgi:hypothetical protein